MRINSLSVDIDTLNASIRALNDRLAGLRGLWEPQVRDRDKIDVISAYLNTCLRSARLRP